MKLVDTVYSHNRSMDLGKLMLLSLKGYFLKKIYPAREINFPDRIGDYKFVKEFAKQGLKKSFKLGIYKNSKGKKAIVKIWSGLAKDFHYYTFKNEIVMYKTLHRVLDRIGKNIPDKYKNVCIPKLIKVKEKRGSLLILLEFVDGDLAQDLTVSKKITAYFKVIDFIKFLGNNLTEEEKKNISRRNTLHYVFLYPLLLIKAIFTNPFAIKYLLAGVFVFCKSIPVLLKNTDVSLVHRDLHFRNILVNKKRTVLIDLQFCVFTQELYEHITTLRYRWMEDTLYKLLLKKIEKKYGYKRNFQTIFRGLSVLSVTHGLIDNKFTLVRRKKWVSFLGFVLNPPMRIG